MSDPTRPTGIRRKTAVTVLARFFSGDAEAMTPAEMFAAAGRDPKDDHANHRWLSNRLIALKRHGLIVPEHVSSGRPGPKKILKIRLTPEGKEALRRLATTPEVFKGLATAPEAAEASPPAAVEVPPPVPTPISPDAYLEMVAAYLIRWQRQHPSLKVTFSIELRSGDDRER